MTHETEPKIKTELVKRQLNSGLSVSAVGLGCMGMSEFYGPTNDARSMRVLDRAVDLGIDLFDTADAYGPHHNEELIGRFLRKRKPDIKVASKFGIVRKPGQYARTIDNSPDYVRTSCEASLQRLGRDQIDLFYVHRINPQQPVEDTMDALGRLVREGKIAQVGLCEVSAATLRRAHAVHPVAAVQTEYSLWTRDVEREVLPACRELGIGLVAYSPLGRGFLTGQYQQQASFEDGDFRASLPRFQEENLDANRNIVRVIAGLAEEKNCTTAQIALAWVLAKGSDIVPIPGTTELRHLESNVAAVSIELTPLDIETLESAIAGLEVAGERYTEEGMKGVNA